jgi:hypothetical protein
MKIILLLGLGLLLTSCSIRKEENFKITNNNIINTDVLSSIPANKVSYKHKVRPILDNRCVVCHGCYDAPCQLKLTSMEGINRGATKEVVYDGSRISAVPPTRLGVDHKSTDEWRQNKFFPVVNDDKQSSIENLENSLIYKFLQLKEINPQPRTGLISHKIDTSISRKQYCSEISEFENFARQHKELGMPFALPNLNYKEFYTLSHWIAQGSKGNDDKKEAQTTLKLLSVFERFLNKSDLKHRLVARYIYEHLFLAHISFKGDKYNNFYRLVRADNKNGYPIENSALRPYDDPKGKFYYRFKLYKPTIVAKSHTLYELSYQKLNRYKELFINPNYKVTTFPSYSPEVASNPFISFKEIPVRSKYQFLLDDSRFFIEGFIKGPVCRGQIALNVIEDRFWVFFLDPSAKGKSNNDQFVSKMNKFLNLPAEEESDFEFVSLWTKYWKQQRQYLTKRNENFLKTKSMSIDEAMNYVWDGDGDNPNAALTVFRHLDSASVREGLIGTKPETTWILNYPIFERIHYLLVAGFNVYGNVSHQLKTRIYMDFLRMEGEEIFLSLLPPDARKETHKSWYGGNRNHLKFFQDEDMKWLSKEFVTGLKSNDKEQEVLKHLRNRVKRATSKKAMRIPKDLSKIDHLKGKSLQFFPDTILLRVGNTAYTLVHNKEYKHVSFFLNDATERDDLDVENDTLTVVKGYEGTYPNIFMHLKSSDVKQFVKDIKKINNQDDYQYFISKYGVRRTQSNFWEYSDWFNQNFKKIEPKRAGILDLNRYH